MARQAFAFALAFVASLGVASVSAAQCSTQKPAQPAWAQCGGIGWTDSTKCVSGYTCQSFNPYYSQCVPSDTTKSPIPFSSSSKTAKSSSKPKATSSSPSPLSSSSKTAKSSSKPIATSSSRPVSPPAATTINGPSGIGKTTRYWDCCKPSCSWKGKAPVTQPVNSCSANNEILTDFNAVSGCDNGGAFMCNNQMPWGVNDNLAYGYAAVSIAGQTEREWCCSCYELTFTSGPANGKKMVIQATNGGGDLGVNHFDLAMPGGGVGQFNACTKQYNAPTDGWGQRYGGVSTRAACDALPVAVRAGCQWRFDWFGGSDNPSVSFKTVACPKELTEHTGCIRTE